jgi:preprotein translocase subunit SecD
MEVRMALWTKALASSLLFLGCAAGTLAAQSAEKPALKFEIRLAENKAAAGLTEATVEGSKNKVYLHKEAALTRADVSGARATVDGKDKPAVEVTLTEAGGKKLARLSEGHMGKPLAILVDGKVIAAPIVRAKITGDKAMITGEFTKEEVNRIARGIQAK